MRRKILIGVGLFVGAILLSAWLVLRSQWLRERLRVWGIAKLEQTLQGTVEIERVGGSLIFDLVLEGVQVTPRDAETPILRFEKGEMGYNPFTLLSANKEIRYVEVFSPVINLCREGEVWNFQMLFPPKDGEKRNPGSGDDPITVRHIAIIDGSLNLGGMRYLERLRSVNLLGSLTYGGGETRIEVRTGRGELPGAVKARGLTGRILIREGALHLEDVHLVTEGSSLFLEGRIAESMEMRLRESRLSLEELDSYLSLGDVLEGEAEGNVELIREGDDLHASGRIEIPRGRFGEYHVEGVTCSLSLENRILTLNVDEGRMAGGELRGRAIFDFGRGRFRAYGKGGRIDLSRLPLNLPRKLRSDLRGTFRIESQDLPWRRPSFRGHIDLRESSLAKWRIDTLRAEFRTAPGSLELDSLEVKTGGGTLILKGRVSAQGTDLSIKASGVELSQIGPALGLSNLEGRLTSDLLFQGELSQPSLLGTFWVKEAGIGRTRFEYLGGNLDMDRVGTGSIGRTDLHFVKGQLLGRMWESGDLNLKAEGTTFSYAFLAAGEDLRLDLVGRGSLTGDSILVEVDTLVCRLGGKEIENDGSLDLSVTGGELFIRRAKLNWPGGSLEASGIFSPFGKSDLSFRADALSLRETCLFFGFRRDVRGEVDFSLDFKGELAEPKMRLVLGAKDIGYLTGSFDTLNLQLSYEGRTLHIDQLDIWREGAKSEVTGSLPLGLSLAPRGELLPDGTISVTAILNNMGTWVFFPFRQFVEVSSGRVHANLDIGGTWETPSLTGTFTLDSATMLARFMGNRLSRVNCHLELHEDRLVVESFSGVSEQGEVRVNGALGLDRFRPTSMDFKVRATGVRVSRIEDVSALVDSDIRIKGSPQEPRFEGEIKVRDAIITMPFEKRKVDPTGLRSGFALDLAVLAERNIWLRNENADLELGADLKVSRTEGKVLLSGILNTTRGYIYPPHLDVPFKVTKGEFNFSKSIELDPALDLQAETQVIHRPTREEGAAAPETVQVKLDVSGTMREPVFKFYSIPPYPLEEIVALLTIGTTRQEMASLGAVGRGGERLASYYFRLKVLRELQETMPIDAIDIRTQIMGEEKRKAELTVGKYVSEDLYVSYTQDLFSRSKNQFKAEYYLWRGAALVGERDEEDKYNVGIQFKFKY